MGIKNSPTYKSWKSMIARCKYPCVHGYRNYGGRGIKVCQRWRSSFFNFLNDMGKRPPGTGIGRINNDGDYTPQNCEWQTASQNGRNKRNNRLVICNGKRMTMAEAIERLGKKKSAVEGFFHRHPGFSGDLSEVGFRAPFKITAAIASQIKSSTLSQRKTAAVFNVSRNLVRLIRAGRIWKSV